MRSGTPVSEARSWVPIIAALVAIFISASVYDLHRRHEIFAFIGVLISLVTMAAIWSTMAAIRTLDVIVMMGVYLLWLIRGTMIRPQSNSELSIVSNELLGGSISLLLVIAALLTFLDRRILIKPAQLALIAIYGLLLMIPHACSMSYGLSQMQIYLRTVMFSLVWLGEDYVYSRDPALGKDRTFDARWWLARLFSVEYVLTMIRSVWILFVHEFLMLFLLLFGLMWLINIKVIKLPAPPDAATAAKKANKGYDSDGDDEEDLELGGYRHPRDRRGSPVPSPPSVPTRRRHVASSPVYDEEQALVPVVKSNAAMADLVRMTAQMIFEELQRVNQSALSQQNLQSSITILNTSAQQRSPLSSSPIALSAAAAAAVAPSAAAPPAAAPPQPKTASASPTPKIASASPTPKTTPAVPRIIPSSTTSPPTAVSKPPPVVPVASKPAAVATAPAVATFKIPAKPTAKSTTKPPATPGPIQLPSSLFAKK